MNTIKTILAYRKQTSSKVFQTAGVRRVPDSIAFTRHLIKYFLYVYSGYSTTSLERHMRPLSDGFHHASVLHSISVVNAQPYIFAPMISKIFTELKKNKNDSR